MAMHAPAPGLPGITAQQAPFEGKPMELDIPRFDAIALHGDVKTAIESGHASQKACRHMPRHGYSTNANPIASWPF